MTKLLAFPFVFCLYTFSTLTFAADCGTLNATNVDSKGRIVFCIPLGRQRYAWNIVYFRENVFGRRILQFRKSNGFEIRPSERTENASIQKFLSLREYSNLLRRTLDFLHQDPKAELPHAIQMDMFLVRDTHRAVVEAVVKASRHLAGGVTPKTQVVDKAVLGAILDSEQVRQTCRILVLYNRACGGHVGTNPVPYLSEVWGLSWSRLSKVRNAGISNDAWFGIPVEILVEEYQE